MAIQPEEREQNVKASVFKYLKDNFEAALPSVPVDYAGVGIDEQNHNEWIRADTMFPRPRYARQVGNGVAANNLMGAEMMVMLNLNIFKKRTVEQNDNAYSQTLVKDTLANLFRVPLGIAVMDYAETGLVRIGTLQTSELEGNNLGLVQSTGLNQYNLTSSMRYVMMWERP